jgi:large subunit ribosomal protein L17
MRHRKHNVKLGRSSAHRRALLASLVCSFVEEKRIKTTIAKAREARRLAEKMITLCRRGTLAARRRAISELRRPAIVGKIFQELVPQFEGRAGGYTRIIKLGRRPSDGSDMVLLEWVGVAAVSKKRKKREKPGEEQKQKPEKQDKKEEKQEKKDEAK